MFAYFESALWSQSAKGMLKDVICGKSCLFGCSFLSSILLDFCVIVGGFLFICNIILFVFSTDNQIISHLSLGYIAMGLLYGCLCTCKHTYICNTCIYMNMKINTMQYEISYNQD